MLSPEQWQEFDRWPKGLTIDPHPRKPCFMGWWAVRPDQAIVFFEEWPRSEFYATEFHGGTKGYLDLIQRIEAGDNTWGHPMRNVVHRFMDPNFGKTPVISTGMSLQREWSQLGLWFNCQIPDKIHDRHIIVQGRLEADQLVFTPNCQNLIIAMERYIHDEHRNLDPKNPSEKPKEAYKDGADVVGYTCIMNPQYYDVEDQIAAQPPVEAMFL